MYLKFAAEDIIIREKVTYLRDQHNLGNQEHSNRRRRFSQMMSIAAKKHDRYQSLAGTSLQVHYGILTQSMIQCFKLIATQKTKTNKKQ